jgi:hypothetical protein
VADTGTTTVDFGAHPGATHASVSVADAAIVTGSLVEAFIFPVATADHSVDEHMVENLKVVARDVSNGVGFTIHAVEGYGNAGKIWGSWTVGWVWV